MPIGTGPSITDLHAPRAIPPVTTADVAHILKVGYGIEATSHPTRLESYWDYNFKVKTAGGPLFCKAYTHDQFHDAQFHADIMGKLTSEGLLVPPVIPTSTGNAVCNLNGLPFIVQQFLPGEVLANLPLTRPIIRELGKTLAQIHNSLEGRIITGNNFKISSWDPRQHELLFSRYEASLKSFSPLARKEIDTVQRKAAAFSHNLQELPIGTTHGDYHPGNILVAHNTIAGILDFNEAIDSWLVGDIGIALSYMMNCDMPRLECAKLFVAGYRNERHLSIPERAFIPLMIQLRLATRVIESRLDGGSTSASNLDLLKYFNDPALSQQWVGELL